MPLKVRSVGHIIIKKARRLPSQELGPKNHDLAPMSEAGDGATLETRSFISPMGLHEYFEDDSPLPIFRVKISQVPIVAR